MAYFPLGLVQWSGLVLVDAVCPPAGPCLSNHCPVPELAQRPLGTPSPRPGVLLSELGHTAPWYCDNVRVRGNHWMHPHHRAISVANMREHSPDEDCCKRVYSRGRDSITKHSAVVQSCFFCCLHVFSFSLFSFPRSSRVQSSFLIHFDTHHRVEQRYSFGRSNKLLFVGSSESA